MILFLIFLVGLQILMLALNVIRYYAFNEKSILALAVFQVLIITFIVHALGELIH